MKGVTQVFFLDVLFVLEVVRGTIEGNKVYWVFNFET